MKLKTLRNRFLQCGLGRMNWDLNSEDFIVLFRPTYAGHCRSNIWMFRQVEWLVTLNTSERVYKVLTEFFYFYVKMLSGQCIGPMERSNHHSCITQRPASGCFCHENNQSGHHTFDRFHSAESELIQRFLNQKHSGSQRMSIYLHETNDPMQITIRKKCPSSYAFLNCRANFIL